MAEKTARVGFRWRPETKEALEAAAIAEGRSASDMAERLVTDGLCKNPVQKPSAPRAKRKG